MFVDSCSGCRNCTVFPWLMAGLLYGSQSLSATPKGFQKIPNETKPVDNFRKKKEKQMNNVFFFSFSVLVLVQSRCTRNVNFRDTRRRTELYRTWPHIKNWTLVSVSYSRYQFIMQTWTFQTRYVSVNSSDDTVSPLKSWPFFYEIYF